MWQLLIEIFVAVMYDWDPGMCRLANAHGDTLEAIESERVKQLDMLEQQSRVRTRGSSHLIVSFWFPYVLFKWNGPKACAKRTGAAASVERI